VTRRFVGLYIATLFIVWQIVNFVAFRSVPNTPILLGCYSHREDGRKMSAVVISLAASPALAESPAPVPQASADTGTITLTTIEVISQELNAAYFGSEALETIPQGENAPLNQVLLEMPGVAQDSFGQIHVRGEHANVQFRINGVELPAGLSVFGQALETRFARSGSLLTGALPAAEDVRSATSLGDGVLTCELL
jgi:hypothetical protein